MSKAVNIKQLAEIIALSVRDLSKEELEELLNILKEEYNLEPAIPEVIEVVAETVEEKTAFDVSITSIGSKKMALIKAAKNVLPGSLMEVKAVVESAPVKVKEGISKEEADMIKEQLEASSEGCVITIE